MVAALFRTTVRGPAAASGRRKVVAMRDRRHSVAIMEAAAAALTTTAVTALEDHGISRTLAVADTTATVMVGRAMCGCAKNAHLVDSTM